MLNNKKLLLLSIFGLLLSLLPLTLNTGRNLEFEYSFMTSSLFLIFFPPWAVFKVGSSIFSDHPKLGIIIGSWLKISLIMIFLVFSVGSSLHALSLCKCYPREFYLWSFLQIVPTIFLSVSAFLALAKLHHNDKLSKTKTIMIFVAIIAAATAIHTYHLWFNPQKRMISLFWGYLHGPIYDEWLPIDFGIIINRCFAVFLALMIIFQLPREKTNMYKITITTLWLVFLTTYHFAANLPSSSNRKEDLDHLLDQTFKTENFIIHYKNTTNSTSSLADAKEIYRQTLFHMSELKKIFNEKQLTIHIYLYPDESTKKLWFGASDTDVTDVITPSIHITPAPYPHPTLRHELVHAMASPFAPYGLGFNPNMVFTEGLAMALTPAETSLSLDEGAAFLIKSGKINNIEILFSLRFFEVSAARAYTIAGSFFSFLIHEYGHQKLLDLYAGSSWESTLGQTRKQVIETWKTKILSHYNKSMELSSEFIYRSSGTFLDHCPHSKATLSLKDKSALPYLIGRRPTHWLLERDYPSWLAEIDPTDKGAQLNILRLKAKDLLLSYQKNAWDKFILDSKSLTTWPPKHIEDIEATLLTSDLLYAEGNYKESAVYLTQLSSYSELNTIPLNLSRQIQIRKTINNLTLSPTHVLHRLYLSGFTDKKIKEIYDSQSWISSYLLLYNYKNIHDDHSLLLTLFRQPPPSSIHRDLVFEWYKLLGHKLMKAGFYHESSTAYASALEFSRAGMQSSVQLYRREALFRLSNINI